MRFVLPPLPISSDIFNVLLQVMDYATLTDITNIIQSYVTNGITNIVRYNISPNSSAARRKLDGRNEARIIQMACGPVPEGHSRWTLRLLEEKARVELDVPIGKDAIRLALKKMNLDLTKMPTGASLPEKMWNS